MKITDFINYWNQWHSEWYRIAPYNPPPKQYINVSHLNVLTSWPLLNILDGHNESTTKEPSWKFFPEPYWGVPQSENLKGVFINFNPGSGGHSQHINTAIEYESIKPARLACHRIWEKYLATSYSETIKNLYSENDYITTNWMKTNRESFIQNYNNSFCSSTKQEGDFVMFELCPWHTKSVNGKVYQYIKNNLGLIDKYIIDFAFETAKNIKGSFKNLIITHGLDKSTVENNITTLNWVATESINNDVYGTPLKKSWVVDVFTKNNTDIYLLNFKNSSNGFPSISHELRDIIEKYAAK
jgi:hypothetical protein